MAEFKKVLITPEIRYTDMQPEQAQDAVELCTAGIDKHVKSQDYEVRFVFEVECSNVK